MKLLNFGKRANFESIETVEDGYRYITHKSSIDEDWIIVNELGWYFHIEGIVSCLEITNEYIDPDHFKLERHYDTEWYFSQISNILDKILC